MLGWHTTVHSVSPPATSMPAFRKTAPTALLWSGGKDSALAIHRIRQTILISLSSPSVPV
jgi:hypothetical protein